MASTTTTTTTLVSSLLYHGESDLTDIRPDILSYGVSDFTERMEESEDIINRKLDQAWYRNIAINHGLNWQTTPFDPTLVLEGEAEVGRCACYKSLELIYLHLMKEAIEPDAFQKQMELFAKLYKAELGEVLLAGISYDWNKSGEIDPGENSVPSVRRLVRV